MIVSKLTEIKNYLNQLSIMLKAIIYIKINLLLYSKKKKMKINRYNNLLNYYLIIRVTKYFQLDNRYSLV